MGAPSGSAIFRIVATVSAIFAIGVVAVSGALLSQSIKYREQFFYGVYGYGGYGGGYGSDYYSGGSRGGYYGGQGQYGYGGTGIGYQSQDIGYDPYRYHRVIAVAAVALSMGIIQFMVSLLLCCVNVTNSKGLTLGYISGSIVILIGLIVCFALAFQYRVIYPFYFYNVYYQSYNSYGYQQYNPEGQAFCAILGIDIIYIIISAIIVGIFAKRGVEYEDHVEWVRPPASAAPGNNDYGRERVA